MKNSILLTTVAAIAALCACSKTTMIPDQGAAQREIALSSFMGPVTKVYDGSQDDDPTPGGAFASVTIPAYYDMYLSTYLTPADGSTSDEGREYFTGALFVPYYDADLDQTFVEAWHGFNPQYWPLNGTLSFVGFATQQYPNNAVMEPNYEYDETNHPNAPIWHNDGVANSVELTIDDNSNLYDDIVYSGTRDAEYDSSEDLPMGFKHAFSVVAFTFDTNNPFVEDDDHEYGIAITGLEVENAYYGGKLTISNFVPADDAAPADPTGTNDPTPTATWGTLTNKVASVTPRNPFTNETLACSASWPFALYERYGDFGEFGDAYIILPPQTGTSFKITYNLYQNGLVEEGLTYTHDCSANDWAMGTKTLYALNFDWNEIFVSPSVSEWTVNSHNLNTIE